MERRDGGRIPEPDAVRPPCPLCFSPYSVDNFVNKALAARGITPVSVNTAFWKRLPPIERSEGHEVRYPFAKGRFVH
jgi:hypothetical protein